MHRSSYLDGLQKEVVTPSFRDGEFIFATWNQLATGTGRLSTTAPNLQSLPKAGLSSSSDRRTAWSDWETRAWRCDAPS